MAHLIDNDSKIITERAEGFGQPSIIRTSGGRIYTGHINDSGYLEIHYSDNSGVNWTLDTTFTDDTGIDMFSFAVSDLDDVFVTFSYATATDVYTLKVKKRDHTAGTWSEILNETSIGSDSFANQIKPGIVWNRGALLTRLHIFWCESFDENNINLKNKYTDNYGSSWSDGSDKTISGGRNDFLCSIDSIISSGNVVIWLKDTYSGYRIDEYIFTSLGVYSGERYDSNYGAQGVMVIDSNDNKWKLYYDPGYYRLSVWQNTVKEFEDIEGTDWIKYGMLAIGCDGSDNIYIFYVKSGDEKCYYKKYDKGTDTWGSETELTSGDGLRIGCEQHSLISSDVLHLVYYTD